MYENAIRIAKEMIARLETGPIKEAFENVADLSIDFCEAVPVIIKHDSIPIVFFESRRKRVHESHAVHFAEICRTNPTIAFIADQENTLPEDLSSSFNYAYSDPFRIGSHSQTGFLWHFEIVGMEIRTGADGLPHEFNATEQRFSPTEKDKIKFIGILNQWIRYLGSAQIQASLPPTSTAVGQLPDKHATSTIEELPKATKLAYLATQYAESQLGRTLTDPEAWNYLNDNGIGGDGELDKYRLPSKATFADYMTLARKELGEKKYRPRGGRTGRSIVDSSELKLNPTESD